MLRFGALLRRILEARGCEVVDVRPEARLTALLGKRVPQRTAKWIGYVDKYLLFPSRLARRIAGERASGASLVHVADHSNAVYVPKASPIPWVVTCHDLLAVRGALGEDTDCPASALGKRLQRRITVGLARATAIACDSTATLGDVERIVIPPGPQGRHVILLPPDRAYGIISRDEALQRLASVGGIPWTEPFLIHVGSNLARKNKPALIRIVARLGARWKGNIVFCGPALPAEILAQAKEAGIVDRVFCLKRPENSQLGAAYALAHALLFPSKCEGFGWPVVEAQACGCPVICSNRTSLPEVGGDAAMVFDLADEAGMADAVLRLEDPAYRAELAGRSRKNLERFTEERMAKSYLGLYTGLGRPSDDHI